MIVVAKVAHASTLRLLRCAAGPDLATGGEAVTAGGGWGSMANTELFMG